CAAGGVGIAVGVGVGGSGVGVAVDVGVGDGEAVGVGVGVKGEPSGPSPYQPTTSKITCVWPAALYTLTLPSDPTLTVTRFGTVCPVAKFRFEAVGRPTSEGYTVR